MVMTNYKAPGPAALEDEIPLRQNQPSLGDIMGIGKQQVPMKQNAESSFGQVMGMEPQQQQQSVVPEELLRPPVKREPTQEEVAGDMTQEEFESIVMNSPDMTPDEVNELSKSVKTKEDLQLNIWENMKIGLGSNPSQREQILKSILGKKAKFRTGEDGVLEFKRPGSSQWISSDESSLLGTVAKQAGLIGEVIGTAAPEIALAYAGGKIGKAVGGKGLEPGSFAESIGAGAGAEVGGIGAGLGALAGYYPTAVMAKKARDWAAEQVGATPRSDEEIAKEVKDETGINILSYVGLGTGKVALSNFSKYLTKRAQLNPAGRFAQLLRTKGEVGELMDSITSRVRTSDAGKYLFGVVSEGQQRMETAITAVKDKVRQIAGEKNIKFQTPELLSSMKSEMSRFGVIFDRSGKATVPSSVGVESAYGMGRQPLDSIAEKYNRLVDSNKIGGITPFDLENLITELQIDSRYSEVASAAEKGVKPKNLYTAQANQKLYSAARNDQDNVFKSVLTGTGEPEEAIMKSSYEQYSREIDEYRTWKDLLDPKKNNYFTDKALQQKNSDHLEQFKTIFGPGSKEWQYMKGSFLFDLMDKSVDRKTGLIDSSRFIDMLSDTSSGYGKDVVDVFMDETTKRKFIHTVKATERLDTSDLITKISEKDMSKFTDGLMSMALWGSGVRILPGTGLNAMKKVTQGVFDMVKSNADFADYLVSEKGIQQWIKHADSQDAKMAAYKIEGALSHILSATTRVKKIAKGGEWTGKYVLKLDPVKLGLSSAAGTIGASLNPKQEKTYVSQMLDSFFDDENTGREPQQKGQIQDVQTQEQPQQQGQQQGQQQPQNYNFPMNKVLDAQIEKGMYSNPEAGIR